MLAAIICYAAALGVLGRSRSALGFYAIALVSGLGITWLLSLLTGSSGLLVATLMALVDLYATYAVWRVVVIGRQRADPAETMASAGGLVACIIGSVIVIPVAALFIYAGNIGLEEHADSAAMRLLVRRDLPLGSSLARTRSFLNSHAVEVFASSRQWDSPYQYLPFQKVGSYDESAGSQIYPGGMVLEATMGQDFHWGMDLRFFFDAKGHLRHYDVETSFTPIYRSRPRPHHLPREPQFLPQLWLLPRMLRFGRTRNCPAQRASDEKEAARR